MVEEPCRLVTGKLYSCVDSCWENSDFLFFSKYACVLFTDKFNLSHTPPTEGFWFEPPTPLENPLKAAGDKLLMNKFIRQNFGGGDLR